MITVRAGAATVGRELVEWLASGSRARALSQAKADPVGARQRVACLGMRRRSHGEGEVRADQAAREHWHDSRYVRRLADVSVGGRPVLIELSVRRMYCENAACRKVTFAEQVPG